MSPSRKQEQTHKHREQTCGCQWMDWGGLEKRWNGVSRCKLLYLLIQWINYKVLLYSIGNYFQYSMLNHNGKEFF